MPTYVYRRSDGTTFEVVQRITDDALTHDSGQKVERVIGTGSLEFQFKGGGSHRNGIKRSYERKGIYAK